MTKLLPFQTLRPIRKGYEAEEAFNFRPTSTRKVPNATADIVKGALWALTKKQFHPSGRDRVSVIPIASPKPLVKRKRETLEKNLIKLREKGRDKVASNFLPTLFKAFPDLRYKALEQLRKTTNFQQQVPGHSTQLQQQVPGHSTQLQQQTLGHSTQL